MGHRRDPRRRPQVPPEHLSPGVRPVRPGWRRPRRPRRTWHPATTAGVPGRAGRPRVAPRLRGQLPGQPGDRVPRADDRRRPGRGPGRAPRRQPGLGGGTAPASRVDGVDVLRVGPGRHVARAGLARRPRRRRRVAPGRGGLRRRRGERRRRAPGDPPQRRGGVASRRRLPVEPHGSDPDHAAHRRDRPGLGDEQGLPRRGRQRSTRWVGRTRGSGRSTVATSTSAPTCAATGGTWRWSRRPGCATVRACRRPEPSGRSCSIGETPGSTTGGRPPSPPWSVAPAVPSTTPARTGATW